jgi:fumarylacetoacetase
MEFYHNTFRNSYTPIGQTLPAGETTPVFGLRLIDFELETAFIDANVMEMIPINEAKIIFSEWFY